MTSIDLMNQLSTAAITNIGNHRSTGRVRNHYGNKNSFDSILQQQKIDQTKQQRTDQVKQEIYERFEINVGANSDSFACYIPSDVLYQMSYDEDLKEKVFTRLEKYSGEEFQKSIMGLEPPVKKCTLIFDEEGDMTAVLDADVDENGNVYSDDKGLYQRFLLQQAAMLPYMSGLSGQYSTGQLWGGLFSSGYSNLYGLDNLYGLAGSYGLNSYNSYKSLQNSLISSALGKAFRV